jgi:hypothetical protein
MRRTRLLTILVMAALLASALVVSAQYTGFSFEERRPPSLYPAAGPGATEIINELRTTNRLLQEQNQLIAQQNRLIRESMAAKSGPGK